MTLCPGQNNGQLLKKIHVGLFAINTLSTHTSGAKITPINARFCQKKNKERDFPPMEYTGKFNELKIDDLFR